MPVTPKRGNAQRQPITTALRNIIREYPAGGCVLRELCQNADDAGATRIEFVLDETYYTDNPLLHPALADYQGPSLVVFNNSKFTERDFESLSRIGDSLKADDMNSTGKFGRGFNSVFNWTDGPMILSGSSLLILDPHEEWSASSSVSQPGGPLYDFVENAGELEMKNQLSSFRSIHQSFTEPFLGTIIRLPLRTLDQASRSNITPGKSTKPSDIKAVFAKFETEMVENLLFLKNIRTIELRIGEEVIAKAEASHDPGIFQIPYREVLIKKTTECWESSFECRVELLRQGKNDVYQFAISHHMSSDVGDQNLQDWGRGFKLFGWAAVAAQLQGPQTPKRHRLYSLLPLPVHTNHPFHIHGMFSVTPDRANIHSGADATLQENSESCMGARWNSQLFKKCVMRACLTNLEFQRNLEESRYPFKGWQIWPAGKQQSKDHGNNLFEDLACQVIREDRPLLPTMCNTVQSPSSCLYAPSLSEGLEKAILDARVPVVVPMAETDFDFGASLPVLTPNAVRSYLHSRTDSLGHLSVNTHTKLLDYVIEDGDYRSLAACSFPLVPTQAGGYSEFGQRELRLSMDKKEDQLFGKCSDSIDTSRLSLQTLKALREHIHQIEKHTSIRKWNLVNSRRYCETHIFSRYDSNVDFITVSSSELTRWVERFWLWINSRQEPIPEIMKCLERLYLLPISEGCLQRITSPETPLVLDVTGRGVLSENLRRLVLENLCLRRDFLFFTEVPFRNPEAFEALKKYDFVVDCGNTLEFCKWLYLTPAFLDCVDNRQRTLVTQWMAQQIRAQFNMHRFKDCELENVQFICRKLNLHVPINRIYKWITLDDPITYVGIDTKKIPFELHRSNVIFLDKQHNQLAVELGLLEVPEFSDLIRKYIIPEIREYPSQKEDLCGLVLQNISLLRTEEQEVFSRVAFVPVCMGGSPVLSPLHKRPIDLVDPDRGIRKLFFSDEHKFPDKSFFSRFGQGLTLLGLVTRLTDNILLERCSEFSRRQNNGELKEVLEKVKHLFGSYTDLDATWKLDSQLNKRWIPAYNKKGNLVLCSPQECRDQSQRVLVDHALFVTDFTVSTKWQKLLGWDRKPSVEILRQQLDGILNDRDNDALSALIGSEYMQDLFPLIHDINWIPGASGLYYRPTDIFVSDAKWFAPYLDVIDKRFTVLLNHGLGIEESPSFQNMRALQDTLAAKETLSEEDIKIAVEIVNQSGCRFPDEDFTTFKAPSREGQMVKMADLTAHYSNDPLHGHLTFLNPNIPEATIEILKIPTLQDRFLESFIDPDDFAQEEDTMSMIQDALRRYPAATTFTEYLANAEDCGSASKIAWVLDDNRCYPKNTLIHQRLKHYQGQAVFCYNDGVFTDTDYKAIQQVGVGSKRKEESKLGRFGRGALTMYHLSNAPCLISGKFFVIFNPERKLLPPGIMSYRPRAGMKIPIQIMRSTYPDHLRPFEGLFGFSSGTEFFKGTLWRFPLSSKAVKQDCTSTSAQHKMAKIRGYLDDYYEEARISLLFLKNVASIEVFNRENGALDTIWRVTSRRMPRTSRNHPEEVIFEAERGTGSTESRWLFKRAVEEAHTIADELQSVQKSGRLESRYGVAVLLSDKPDPKGRIYMDTPLRSIFSQLPVFITADMVIQSNRQEVPIEDSADDNGAAMWNRWILTERVVPLYLSLLETVMSRLGVDGYRYWPTISDQAVDPISKLVTTGFWERIITRHYKLFPPVFHPAEDLDDRSASSEDDTPNQNLTIAKARFNFLQARKDGMGKNMVWFLSSLGVRNIVEPSRDAITALESLDHKTISRITPEYVRMCLKSDTIVSELQRLVSEFPGGEDIVSCLLRFILEDTPSANSLCGVNILLLANGKIKALNSDKKGESFLIPGSDVQTSLLAHRPDLQLDSRCNAFEAYLLEKTANVEMFELSHVPRFLKGLDPHMSTAIRQLILHWVWRWYDDESQKNPDGGHLKFLSSNGLAVHAIRTPSGCKFMDHDWIQGYNTEIILEQFTEAHGNLHLQSVANSSAMAQNAEVLLSSFPGLHFADPKTYPSAGLLEEMVTEPKGLYRLLRCIELLAVRKGSGFKSYVSSAFQPHRAAGKMEAIVTILTHSGAQWESAFESSPSTRQYFFTHLRKLPIWPVKGSAGIDWKTAEDIVLAPNTRLDWPEAANSSSFVIRSYQQRFLSELEFLQVARVSIPQFLRDHQCLVHGSTIPSSKVEEIAKFLNLLADQYKEYISQHAVLFDGDRKVVKLSGLYDHRKDFFRAAFCNAEDEAFLHPTLRNLRWEVLDMTVGQVNGFTALACARQIHKRHASNENTNQLLRDAEIVWNSILPKLGELGDSLEQLAILKFVPAQSSFQPSYRRSRMIELVPVRGLTSLYEGIGQEYFRCAWSQLPLFISAPASSVLRGLSLAFGLATVFDHLIYISQHRAEVQTDQISECINDIKACYRYIQDEEEHEEELDDSAEVWLNIDDSNEITTADFRNGWQSASSLVLGLDYDTDNLQRVKGFLNPFSDILTRYGVETVVQAKSLPRPELAVPDSDTIVSQLRKFRRGGILTDFALEANDGRKIEAHRVVLATRSPYFKAVATVEMQEASSGTAKFDQFTYDTLRDVVDYIYEEEMTAVRKEGSDDDAECRSNEMEALLNLLHAASHFHLDGLKDIVEWSLCDARYIRPETAKWILKAAETFSLRSLEKESKAFIVNNMKLVERESSRD